MTGAETLAAALEPRPTFRGPLHGQRPKRTGSLSADPWLVIAVTGLLGVGLVMVFNVSYFLGSSNVGDPYAFFRKHVFSIALGGVIAAVVSRLGSDTFRRLAYPLLLAALVSLTLVLVPGIGSARGGAQRWLALGPLSFQPSELAKLALVLYLAASLDRKRERLHDLRRGVLPYCLVAGVLALLLLAEPDFGSTALVALVLLAMLFVAGARPAHLLLLCAGGVPALVYLMIAEPYRWARLMAFLQYDLDPLGMGFQLRQSLIAFGSGGVIGVGLGQSQQKMFFLPAAHTDFIFSVVGEELGLIGALGVLGLFAWIALRGLRIAAAHPDRFGSLFAFGLTLLVVAQGLLNVGVVLGCLPTKGLVLPFISYGGSAMLLALAEVGALLALARETG
ncbi:MAG TPA: putative lipid II flippase FtsW [Candidatus Limnocylindria bacterium]|nr:putative lipid II flippase FtsW [Candidatus Limnocylindria bacterium]